MRRPPFVSRWVVATAVLLVLFHPALALGQELQIGLKAGFARADLLGIPSEEWNARTSPAGGALLGMRLTSWLLIRSELLLMPKNVFKSEILDTPDGPIDRRFDRDPLYLEIPILAQLTLPGLPSPMPGLLVGLAPSFELSCVETFSVRRLADGVKLVEDQDDCDRRLTVPESPEIAAVVGLLAELPVGGVILGLEARYTRGLFDLGRSRFAAERNFPEHRTTAVSVLLQVTNRLSR